MEALLLAWFSQNGRDLPWRKTHDPYAILVSEVMLQQTQVARVVPRYLRWLERWPAVESLAAATPADVIREWQGLGYNRRALNLHRAARQVAADGWPDDLTELPGVGRYTADAVARFALRPSGASGRRQRPPGARPDRQGSFGPASAHALMDLGATVCLARIPALRRMSARDSVPVTREALRAAPEARPLRRLVPPAPGSTRSASWPKDLAGAHVLDGEAVDALEADGLVQVRGGLVTLPR